MTHTLYLDSATFRQALTSALIFTRKNVGNILNNICLHQEGPNTFSVNSMDGHTFYQQTLEPLYHDGNSTDMPPATLPRPFHSFIGHNPKGQTLLPREYIPELIKWLPKTKDTCVTLTVDVDTKNHHIQFTTPLKVPYTFISYDIPYPNYYHFLDLANTHKTTPTGLQGQLFDPGCFTRIMKALPPKPFTLYLAQIKNQPSLIQQDTISIVFMPLP